MFHPVRLMFFPDGSLAVAELWIFTSLFYIWLLDLETSCPLELPTPEESLKCRLAGELRSRSLGAGTSPSPCLCLGTEGGHGRGEQGGLRTRLNVTPGASELHLWLGWGGGESHSGRHSLVCGFQQGFGAHALSLLRAVPSVCAESSAHREDPCLVLSSYYCTKSRQFLGWSGDTFNRRISVKHEHARWLVLC